MEEKKTNRNKYMKRYMQRKREEAAEKDMFIHEVKSRAKFIKLKLDKFEVPTKDFTDLITFILEK